MRLSRVLRFVPRSADETRVPKVVYESGEWAFSKEKMSRFAAWCKQHHVRANQNIKISSTEQFARCARAAKNLAPGQAIVTAPPSACFNFLVASRQQLEAPNGFPIQIDWLNWNKRMPFLRSQSYGDFGTAGWMTRALLLEEKPFAEYFSWLCDDSRNKNGISQGIAREKGDDNPNLDMLLSQMVADACEEGDVFLDKFFTCNAALLSRSVLIEEHAISCFLNGTTFFKSRIGDLFVPTLIPFVDCCPHREDGRHNCMVDFIPGERVREALPFVAREMQVDEAQLQDYAAEGFFALRPTGPIEQGDVLFVRGWPKLGEGAQSREYADMHATHVGVAQNTERLK